MTNSLKQMELYIICMSIRIPDLQAQSVGEARLVRCDMEGATQALLIRNRDDMQVTIASIQSVLTVIQTGQLLMPQIP